MTSSILYDVQTSEVSQSFITKIHFSTSKGLPHAEPISMLKRDERELVQSILQMLQGFPSSTFYWDGDKHQFCFKNGIYLSHLSQASLCSVLNQFAFCGTCLKKVDIFVKKIEAYCHRAPTLNAFAHSVKSWLKRLQDIALKEEVKLASSESGKAITLLALIDSTSSLCSGAEYLVQVVYGAIPSTYFDSMTSFHANEMAVYILDHLFKKLNEVCLVQGGEEEAYHMVLVIFMKSLLPYLEGLDSWLYEGTLDDPYEEMFFYANEAVAIDQPAFWEMSYLLRSSVGRNCRTGEHLIPSATEATVQVKKEASDSIPTATLVRGRDQNDLDSMVCPVFLKNMARAIISAGKSLQLVQHVRDGYIVPRRGDNNEPCDFRNHQHEVELQTDYLNSCKFDDASLRFEYSDERSITHFFPTSYTRGLGDLTLSEVFLISLAGLIGDGDHIYEFSRISFPGVAQICKTCMDKQKIGIGADNGERSQTSIMYEKNWSKFFTFAVSERRHVDTAVVCSKCSFRGQDCSSAEGERGAATFHSLKSEDNNIARMHEATLASSFCSRNPIISVCTEFLQKNMATWNALNISRNFHLPPLNDENLRKTIFGENYMEEHITGELSNRGSPPRFSGTDYTFGFQFDELKCLRLEYDNNTLETLFPFPTLLPGFQENLPMSELLPIQKCSTLASKILNWTENIKLKDTPQPTVIIKECIAVYIKRQVDQIGKHILSKLMSDWKLMDELYVLRAIYLLGSGDLLKEFLLVIYDKMDKGDSWDDYFELNTALQESIRNSADGTLLSAPDSLVVSLTKNNALDEEENAVNGIGAFDILKFTYKVSWPLDLIANAEALKKYNQIMGFLLKVKRAKFLLDKARRWKWKGRSSSTPNYKHHLLVEQKLLHFVNTFHQYVIDRVLHSAWVELCTGMASAGSLDEVIEVHEAYLLSILQQCFLCHWGLIGKWMEMILALAIDFCTKQQTLNSGGASPAAKAIFEIEVDRIEKLFDGCIMYLLIILPRKLIMGYFPHLVDLLTRINYNYFYVSDSENLLMEAPSTRLENPAAFKAVSNVDIAEVYLPSRVKRMERGKCCM